jgi:hypothetical protein
MNANVEMNNGNNNRNEARQNAAIQSLRNRMQQIPHSEEITRLMIIDWILNVGIEDLVNMNYEHIRELIEGIYQDIGQNPPGFTDDDYKYIFNAFSIFVHEYHGVEPPPNGGKRRRHSRRRRTTRKSKKTHRAKKSRRHN